MDNHSVWDVMRRAGFTYKKDATGPGQRLPGKVPFGHWNTMTFIAALRRDRVEAPWRLDSPVNAKRFLLYVEQVLVPALKPGDIVIIDDLGSHKGKTVRQAMQAAGARILLLPEYSPDLNPIEQAPSAGRTSLHTRGRLYGHPPDPKSRHAR